MSEDYYKILGVERSASQKEIADAYRKIAIKHHPDKTKGDPDSAKIFKAAAEAFEVLNDSEKRQRYDRFGTAGPIPGGFQGHGLDPFSIFENFFRGHQGFHQTHKGEDVHRSIEITLEEAYSGCEKSIDLDINEICNTCSGSGVSESKNCETCHGRGQVMQSHGFMSITSVCNACRGSGQKVISHCKQCSGHGQVKKGTTQQTINIPSGIEDGTTMVLRGRGLPIKDGISGDLLFSVRIKPHILYERQGPNLACSIPVTYAQIVEGCIISLPLPSKADCEVKINAGSQSGTVLRLKGCGMPSGVNGKGDLFAKIQLETPKEPSNEFLKIVKKLSVIDDKESYESILRFQSIIKELKKE